MRGTSSSPAPTTTFIFSLNTCIYPQAYLRSSASLRGEGCSFLSTFVWLKRAGVPWIANLITVLSLLIECKDRVTLGADPESQLCFPFPEIPPE